MDNIQRNEENKYNIEDLKASGEHSKERSHPIFE